MVITNEDFTEVVGIKRGETFRWYRPKERSFDGIELKFGSFNGTDPIFPFAK